MIFWACPLGDEAPAAVLTCRLQTPSVPIDLGMGKMLDHTVEHAAEQKREGQLIAIAFVDAPEHESQNDDVEIRGYEKVLLHYFDHWRRKGIRLPVLLLALIV